MVLPSSGDSRPNVLARVFGERLARSLGRPLVVDRKPAPTGARAVAVLDTARGAGRLDRAVRWLLFHVINQAL